MKIDDQDIDGYYIIHWSLEVYKLQEDKLNTLFSPEPSYASEMSSDTTFCNLIRRVKYCYTPIQEYYEKNKC